jgi:hypothetical protein
MPGLVPGIQTSASFGACGTMDPSDTRRDGNSSFHESFPSTDTSSPAW